MILLKDLLIRFLEIVCLPKRSFKDIVVHPITIGWGVRRSFRNLLRGDRVPRRGTGRKML
jgi:hypothetical protein